MENHATASKWQVTLFSLFAVTCPVAAEVKINTVAVGNAGNAAHSTTGYGSVNYNYHIGTYEVTNAQYTAFLNAVAATDTHNLYKDTYHNHYAHGGIERHGEAGSYTYTVKEGFGNRPVNYVNYWDAARFTNWMTNGQLTGSQDASTTESGVYNLNGVTYPTNNFLSAVRDETAFNNGGIAIANGDEWYKAAYYDPSLNGGAGGYWLYPTQSNEVPLGELAPGGSNSGNFMPQDTFTAPYGTSIDVGSYIDTTSAYGVHDMVGNVSEWTEDINSYNGQWINVRGGQYGSWPTIGVTAEWEYPYGEGAYYASQGTPGMGFRVVSLYAIPEPSTYATMAGVAVVLLAVLRRRVAR